MIRSTTLPAELIAVADVDGEQWACAALVRMSRGRRSRAVVERLHAYERDGEPVDVLDVPDEVTEALESAATAAYYEQTEPGDSYEDGLGDHLHDEARDARAMGWR